jgi:hypothetical protein
VREPGRLPSTSTGARRTPHRLALRRPRPLRPSQDRGGRRAGRVRRLARASRTHYNDDRFHATSCFVSKGRSCPSCRRSSCCRGASQDGPLPDTAGELDRFFPDQPEDARVTMQILANNPGARAFPDRLRRSQAAIDGATKRLYVINPYLGRSRDPAGHRRGGQARRRRPRDRAADPHSFPPIGGGPARSFRPSRKQAWTSASTRAWPTPRSSWPNDTVLAGYREPRCAEPAPQLGAPAADQRRADVADQRSPKELFEPGPAHPRRPRASRGAAPRTSHQPAVSAISPLL